MTKLQYVGQLKAKDDVNDIFLVKYIAVMESRDGKNYLNMVLADSTGDLEARKWHNASEVVKNVSKGDFVRAKGKVNNYQGRTQLIVNDVEFVAGDDLNRGDFVPKSTTAPEKMYEELTEIVESLEDVYIRDLLKAILYEPDIKKRLLKWYAGKSIHHAYEGGLLEHILSCSKLALFLSPHYGTNLSYVVAGAIMHDMCKIYELTDAPLVEYTDEGKLVGHLVRGVEILDHYASKIKGFPHNMKNHLKHILLSHHGEYEYGSPKIPQTREAFLVHLIDLMDSKISSMDHIIKNDKMQGKWSGYVKHLDRIVYKEELPTYTKYLEVEEDSKKAPKKNHKGEKELTHNMAKMLSGFKVNDEN